MRRTWTAAAAVLSITVVACSNDAVAPEPATQLASVFPAGGSIDVDPGTAITIQFSHPMMNGMENYVMLHEGSVNGPVVAGVWSWSADRLRLSFHPASPLRSATQYTIHLGGGMMDANGRTIGFGHHGEQMGGRWATGSMMHDQGHMGSEWQHTNGTCGMVFTFTTR
jgi:hypothetical protein